MRAQSISINTIIVAAIALVVLILITLIFTTNIQNWRRGTDSCSSNGGTCYEECPENTETSIYREVSYSCPTEAKPTCCLEV